MKLSVWCFKARVGKVEVYYIVLQGIVFFFLVDVFLI